jgi:hypothetical protein
MKKFIVALAFISSFFMACNSSQSMKSIEPKSGIFDLPAKGELLVWKGLEHPSFLVSITNPNPQQSCEIYTVKSNGKEKWISPSLLASSTLTVQVPKNGHLYFKNFNPNNLVINYNINQ